MNEEVFSGVLETVFVCFAIIAVAITTLGVVWVIKQIVNLFD